MIFIGYETSSGITITGSVTNTNADIDSGIASLKVAQSDNSDITNFIVAAGDSQTEYVVIGHIDP